MVRVLFISLLASIYHYTVYFSVFLPFLLDEVYSSYLMMSVRYAHQAYIILLMSHVICLSLSIFLSLPFSLSLFLSLSLSFSRPLSLPLCLSICLSHSLSLCLSLSLISVILHPHLPSLNFLSPHSWIAGRYSGA